MKFSAVLLASAAALVSAKKFTLVAIRSGTDIQNAAVDSDGEKLIVGDGGDPTTYEIKEGVLYANGKAVQFPTAAIEDDASKGTSGVTIENNYVNVPGFDWTACAAQGRAYHYTVSSSEDCKQGATPFAPRVMWVDGEESAAAGNATVTKTGVVTAKSTALVTITSCADDKCHKPTGEPSKPVQVEPTTAPAQANGAAAFGVSVAAAGVAAAALLI
ncbi:hypothetical protein CJU90_1848 [Yarrowia sp. C11]|nr:hypothetical protein CKK34_5876 [Yarrowia sp. E02]KAG5371786.1 hypothetical protein CJU90_1848 [Yarrowia sp. C11]